MNRRADLISRESTLLPPYCNLTALFNDQRRLSSTHSPIPLTPCERDRLRNRIPLPLPFPQLSLPIVASHTNQAWVTALAHVYVQGDLKVGLVSHLHMSGGIPFTCHTIG